VSPSIECLEEGNPWLTGPDGIQTERITANGTSFIFISAREIHNYPMLTPGIAAEQAEEEKGCCLGLGLCMFLTFLIA
jgi:hypothetical protein